MLYTLHFYRDDMGSFKQPGCKGWEEALWFINNAREHDNLPPLDMDDILNVDCRAKLIPQL